ncbi:5591_t:CDS:1, partial [Scutellospora calospora]
ENKYATHDNDKIDEESKWDIAMNHKEKRRLYSKNEDVNSYKRRER